MTEVTGLQQVFRFFPTPRRRTTSACASFYPNDWSSAPKTFLQAYSGWDDYIVCDAAAKCLEKEESFEHADRLLRRRDQPRGPHPVALQDHERGLAGPRPRPRRGVRRRLAGQSAELA